MKTKTIVGMIFVALLGTMALLSYWLTQAYKVQEFNVKIECVKPNIGINT